MNSLPVMSLIWEKVWKCKKEILPFHNMIDQTFFTSAYPFEHTVIEKWNTILYTSVFLSLIMIFLQPFGFFPVARFHLYTGYLVIALLILSINYFSFPRFFPALFEDETWSVSKAFLFLIYNFFLIGFWNHIFNALVIKNDPTLLVSGIELTITITKTIAIGSIASCLYILVRYNLITRKYLEISQDLNQSLKTQLFVTQQPEDKTQTIELSLENKSVNIPRNKLKFISAEGNYLAFYFEGEKKSRPQLQRGRIKHVEKVLEKYPEFFRCHRSFIVNLKFIESTWGNSQGLSIRLLDEDNRLPVARSKIKQLKLLLD